jgi:hypothetical protein
MLGSVNEVGMDDRVRAKTATIQNPSAVRGRSMRKIERMNPRMTAAAIRPPYWVLQLGSICSIAWGATIFAITMRPASMRLPPTIPRKGFHEDGAYSAGVEP